MEREIVVSAKGYVLKNGDQFLPGLLINIDGYELEVTVEDKIFLTSEACEAFLVEEMPKIVQDLCDRLGVKQVKAQYYGATSQEMH